MKLLSSSRLVKLTAVAIALGSGVAFAANDKPVPPATQTTKAKEPSVIAPPRQFTPIDINSAKKDEFKKLNGVTEAHADRIIAGRPYLTKYTLVTEKIIPEDVFQAIKVHIFAKQPDKKGAPHAAKP